MMFYLKVIYFWIWYLFMLTSIFSIAVSMAYLTWYIMTEPFGMVGELGARDSTPMPFMLSLAMFCATLISLAMAVIQASEVKKEMKAED